MATIRDIVRVEIIETPMFFPIILTMKLSEKMKGRNTIRVVNVEANTERHTSAVPCLTAFSAGNPVPDKR